MGAVRTAITATSLANAAISPQNNAAENQTNGTAQNQTAAQRVVQQKTTTSTDQAAINAVMSRFSVPGAIQGAATGAMPGMMGMNPMAAMMGAGMGAGLGALGGGDSGSGAGSSGSSRRRPNGGGTSNEEWSNSGGCSGPESNIGNPGTGSSDIDANSSTGGLIGAEQAVKDSLPGEALNKAMNLAGDKAIELKFGAEWCGPCKQYDANNGLNDSKNIIADSTSLGIPGANLYRTNNGKTVLKVDVDKNPNLGSQLGIDTSRIPAFGAVYRKEDGTIGINTDPNEAAKLHTKQDSVSSEGTGEVSGSTTKSHQPEGSTKSSSELFQDKVKDMNGSPTNYPEAVSKHLDTLSSNGQECSSRSCKSIPAIDGVHENGSYFTKGDIVYSSKEAMEALGNQDSVNKYLAEYNKNKQDSAKLSLHQLEKPNENGQSTKASKQEFMDWAEKKHSEHSEQEAK